MNWTDLIVEVTQEHNEVATDILTGLSEGGLYIEDYAHLEQDVLEIAHIDLIEDTLLQKPKDLVLIHVYLSPEEAPAPIAEHIQGLFSAMNIPHRIVLNSVRQEDWENAWKQHYHPIEIGEKLVVVPSWEHCESTRIQLQLDPGMAFGTGTHETTLLCLETLEKEIRGGETLLDIGTGSGILAVAALLLGAQHAVGIDIDPLCVRTARENAECNGVQDRLQLICGDLASEVTGRFPLITANIVADAIIRLAPALPSLLQEDGLFVASGVLTQRASEVCTALQNVGLVEPRILQKNDWVAILARMPKAEE